jgi:hypothetical protein
MEVNRISKQTLGSYRFACLFPLLACPMLTMIFHKLTQSNLTEVVFVKDFFEPFTLFFMFTHKNSGPEIFHVCTHEEKDVQHKITFLWLLD